MTRNAFRMDAARERRRYQPTLHVGLPRTPRGRAARRVFWFERVIMPALFLVVLLYVLARVVVAL